MSALDELRERVRVAECELNAAMTAYRREESRLSDEMRKLRDEFLNRPKTLKQQIDESYFLNNSLATQPTTSIGRMGDGGGSHG